MVQLADIDLWRDLAGREAGAASARLARRHALRDDAIALARDEGLARPRASWRIVAFEGEPGEKGTLCLEGHLLDAPWLVPASGRLTAVACAVATVGGALEARVRTLFGQRRAALAVALDGVANELLLALSRRVQDRLLAEARRQGLTVAGELRAGDPGLALQAQPTVLALADAAAIGVTLTRTLMMHPAKSTSIVQGVGFELPVQQWSRCDHCASRPRCRLTHGAA